MYLTPKSNSTNNSTIRKVRKATISKDSMKKLQKSSNLLQKALGVKNKKNTRTRKRKRIQIQTRPYNVSASRDITSKTYKKQRISKKQQRIINRRFKNGYSPFIDRVKNSLQLTTDVPNLAKWIWRTGNNLKLIRKAFACFPMGTAPAGETYETENNYYVQSSEQSIYFSQIKYIYELRNPNNYDITVTIYDIVYKEDTEDRCYDNVAFNDPTNPPSDTDYFDDPISLIARGIEGVTGYQQPSVAGQSSSAVIVADSNNLKLQDSDNPLKGFGNPQLKPTDSYPFNIYCKILKKRIYRLEPGATMTHIFTYKPKALLTRGYIGYKYKKQFASTSANNNIAIGNFTCGCLFKVTGQVFNSGNDTSTEKLGEVGYFSGNIALVESIENKWYTMNDRYNYIFNQNNLWNPTADEYATATNPTDVNMETVAEASTTGSEGT